MNLCGGSNISMGLELSVAPKPECGITQLSSGIAFYNVLTSLSSLPSMTISLVALVGLSEKVGKSINQSINQHFYSMTTAAQRAAVVKINK